MIGPTLLIAQAEAGGLTPAGTVIMAVSILGVLGLCAFCMNRILRDKRPSEHHHAPLDIDMPDDDS